MEEMNLRYILGSSSATIFCIELEESFPYHINSEVSATDIDELCHVGYIFFFLQGNIQIFHDGEWGTICDDEWDLYDAKIGNM